MSSIYGSIRARARRMSPALLLGLAALGGCGGGTDQPDPIYVSWINNANDTLIRDANNEAYAVRIDDRRLVHLDSVTSLNGLTVESDAKVRDHGVIIGAVTAGISTAGQSIAVLTCTSGRSMDVRLVSAGWSTVCL